MGSLMMTDGTVALTCETGHLELDKADRELRLLEIIDLL